MLGPSILITSPPLCTGYAYHAWHAASQKTVAGFGLAIAGIELLALVTLMIVGLFVN